MPVTFSGCAGFVHDGGGSTGVLMLPAWGFEEFTIRRGWSGLAGLLAGAGYCCLRFDWPGAGDSLGDTSSGITLEDWRTAVKAGIDLLVTQKGVARVVLVGHGVGGLLAPHFADRPDIAAVAIMAPQNEGRSGLRELAVWSQMVGSFLRLPASGEENMIEIAGHRMARPMADEIAALRIENSRLPETKPLLALLRQGGLGAADWPKRLTAAGFEVTAADYAGYDGFLAHTLASVPPLEDFDRLRGWLEKTVPAGPARPQPAQGSAVEPLHGDGFSERPMLFGANDGLFGILCTPEGQPARAVVVLINSGDNYHIGWARMHVHFARALAQGGIASFRIDTGGIGDAAATEGHLYYVDRQVREVLMATDTVEPLGLGPVLLSGRCSGGYAAVQAAAADRRVAGLVAVNSARLAIGAHETFEQVMSAGTSSVADYGRRALSPRLVIDILTGRMPLSTVTGKGARIVKTLLSMYFPKLAGVLTRDGAVSRAARQQAESLSARGVPVYLIYAENDGGIDELSRHFGKRAPEDYDHATVRIASGAEHNMTAPHAREAILQGLFDAVDAVTGPRAKA